MAGFLTARASPPPRRRVGLAATAAAAAAAIAATAVAFASLPTVGQALNFDLPPGQEECFYEEVHAGRTISGAYAVTQGSHMDIDMRVYNPKSLVVFEALREGEGKFTIPADADGSYKLCFSNKMSMVSHKTVKLVVDNGDGPDLTGLAKKEHMDSVEQTLITIAHSARMIAFHQEEYRQLHDRHLVTVTSTNRRVKWWSLIECLAVLAVSGLQVAFIKRLFNKPMNKRMV